jgi:hypothetical protein
MIRRAIEIYYDDETGEVVEVRETKQFQRETSLCRLDVLGDAIEELQGCYEDCGADEVTPHFERLAKMV